MNVQAIQQSASAGFGSDDGSPGIEDAFRAGMAAGEFEVHYQPIIHARTRKLDAVECLLRWAHPQRGLLCPGSFAYAFDQPEMADEITRFVLDSACRTIRACGLSGGLAPRVAINVLPSQLANHCLPGLIGEIARRHGVDPGGLELELVESEAVLKCVVAPAYTAPLRAMGVHLALDDFGTGYSSLSALAVAQVDTVKLAREFLAGPLGPDSRTSSVLQSLIELAAKLALRVVVEGVETEAQLDWLAAYPNVYAQGYYIGRPHKHFPLEVHGM